MIARTGPPTLTRPSAIALALAMQLPLNSNADGAVPIPTDAYLDEYGTLYDHIGMLHDHEVRAPQRPPRFACPGVPRALYPS